MAWLHQSKCKNHNSRSIKAELEPLNTLIPVTEYRQQLYEGHSLDQPYTSLRRASFVKGIDLKWTFKTGNVVLESPAVANGVVYAGSGDGNVYALNTATGAKLWSVAEEGVLGSPAVANGIVYFGDVFTGKVYAVNAKTGALIWIYLTSGSVEESPAVANGPNAEESLAVLSVFGIRVE